MPPAKLLHTQPAAVAQPKPELPAGDPRRRMDLRFGSPIQRSLATIRTAARLRGLFQTAPGHHQQLRPVPAAQLLPQLQQDAKSGSRRRGKEDAVVSRWTGSVGRRMVVDAAMQPQGSLNIS